MSDTLSERKKRILYSIITEYIHTASPVGSQTITKYYDISLSPATVRNIMAELEELGYLTQPHTSAGRIPTDKGFRFYIDALLELRTLNRKIQEEIKSLYKLEWMDIEDVMKETSRVLSLFSQHMGIVMAPKLLNTRVKRVELIKVKERYILVILILTTGVIYNRIVHIQEKLTQEDLDRMSNFLNSVVSDLNLREVKRRLVEEMKKEKTLFDRLLFRALEIGKTAVTDAATKEDIYIEGRTNIFIQPEFRDIQKMSSLFKSFEDKSILIKLLDECLDTGDLKVFIGSESEYEELSGCSVIATPYTIYSDNLGTLGVIGPTRMDYAKVIPLVKYTAELLSKIFTM